MSERKYSLAEIDQMRRDVHTLLTYERWEGARISYGGWEDHERRENTAVEERLRTYLLSGIDPAELSEAAKTHVAQVDARWNEYQASKKAREADERGKSVASSAPVASTKDAGGVFSKIKLMVGTGAAGKD